ncbi:MAG: putative alpha-L-glutamate ligase [Saprospiraceae bacterium]|nr:MAG: putative alpha-L-glutamate ligase [Saprospiraceae bacterium]
MRIGILSRGPQLYSTQSIYQAGLRRGHTMYIVDHIRCNLLLNEGRPTVLCDDVPLQHLDAIIPRIGASVTSQGAAVINQFQSMKVFTTTKADALLECRDKLRCLQRLAHFGIPIPCTVFPGSGQAVGPMIDTVGGLPVVIKLLESTHGIGVILAETVRSVESTIEAFHRLREKVIIQEYIKESNGADIRVLVVAGEVIAVMKRQARAGEFRSNLHRGASATVAVLSPREEALALRAVRVMGLDVAGVDILRSSRGPLIMEVNASPGLEGIETITKVDIAVKIISFIEKQVKKPKIEQ